MKNKTSILTKLALLATLFALGLSLIPFSTAMAASATETDTPPTDRAGLPRLSLVWQRLQHRYERQDMLLDKANEMNDRLQDLIDRAAANGKDVTAVQAALDVFNQALKDAHPIHESAKGIIASHKGFDDQGNVTDKVQALETVQALGDSLKQVRDLIKDPFTLLRQAIRAFKEANRPTTTP